MMRKEFSPEEAEQIYYDAVNAVENINENDYLEDAIDTLKRITSLTIRNVLNSRGIEYGLNDTYHQQLYPIEKDVTILEKEYKGITKLSDYKKGLRRKPKIRKTTNKIEMQKSLLKGNISVIKKEILELLQRISKEKPLKKAP